MTRVMSGSDYGDRGPSGRALDGMDASNDNGQGGVLEARFHPHGRGAEFIVIGNVVCCAPTALLEIAPDLAARVPEAVSMSSLVSNLIYLTMMCRPRPFECLRSLDNRYWSFVPVGPELDRMSH